ncbi:collagen alpha-1(I) chain-like isoform X3 [Amphibalanus amphitrite]|uniref:collagen alpha-1(I) chain-like isoform X3 n=1 Tax=Amphibalanus amphitrite TaxID=1232801 RepID=UPI001C90E3EA|nr:collagen alpha-1(I) chain-like isoform X3 [Amphibalanus amphitrite]
MALSVDVRPEVLSAAVTSLLCAVMLSVCVWRRRRQPATPQRLPPLYDRPCTAATDSLPSVAAIKPWWEKEPDRPVPQASQTRTKDSPSRRSSVDRTARPMQLPSGSSAAGGGDRKPSPPTTSTERHSAAAGDGGDSTESPLAFTVDFGPADKRLHVKDSISRWAPRSRRSAAGKDEREETRSDSGDLKVAGSGVPRPRSLLRRRQGAPGYHSEGYFSSDQDVDSREGSRRAALPRQSALARTPSPRGGSGSGSGRLAARRATVTRVPASSGLKKSATMGAMPPRQEQPSSRGGGGREEDTPDDVSEAGTYTIENEPDGEEAARQVDEAFGGLEDYGEERRSDAESSSKEGSPDRDTETSSKPSAYSSGGSNWIEQWAAEVTKHNQENLKKAQKAPSPGATTKPPTGSSSPWSRQTVSPDGSASRPRRKLPTPPGLSRSPVTGAGEKSSPSRSAGAGASLDTESYLRTTEDVMSALQARIDAAHTADDSDSVCSSEGSDGPAGPPPSAEKRSTGPTGGGTTEFKFNRALSLRRARLGLDTESATSGSSKRPTPPRPSSGGRKHSDSESGGGGKAAFARSDGGRYSLRMANGNTKTPPSRPSAARKTPGSGGPPGRALGSGPRAAAQAAQASRDQEMANWKRRKNYDPLKAAKEARNKKTESRGGSQSDTTCNTAAPLRSASFHGTDGFGSALLRRSAFASSAAAGSEDESAVRRRSPLVAARSGAALPTHRLGHPDDSDPSDVFHDGASAASSTRKVSLDGSRRLSRGPAPASLKNKVKLEALDNLVISTIHTLSTKIRGNSESLVSKLKCQFDEEDVRHTLLDDVMTTLTTDTPSSSKTSSRDLAGILKNLRKVEQAVQVLEQVLCDDDCDLSDDGELDVADKFGDGFY